MALQSDLRTVEPFFDRTAEGLLHPGHPRCLCRFDDGAVFAYAERGHEFIRASDRELWAIERDDALVSARSGELLAQRRGRVYFEIDTDEPLYYERAI
jgi:hypothetical protein